MRTYSTIDIIKSLQSQDISLFTLADFAKLFSLNNQQTLYKKIARLEQKQLIRKLTKGKYQFLLNPGDDYTLANFLYSPSYLSLETALSFHSLITGFPYQFTSITPRPTKTISLNNQEYHYSHFATHLFWGYEKIDSFLIADPEKALLDYLYLASKGLRNLDLSEFDLSHLDRDKLALYADKFDNKHVTNLIAQLNL